MSKNTVTPEQIQEWKDKHGGVYELPIENKIIYLRAPKMVDFKAGMTQLVKNGEIDYAETMLRLLTIGGDVEIINDDEYFSELKRKVQELIEYEPAEIIRESNFKRRLIIEGFEVVVRKPTREDLRKAEQQNPNHKQFVTQEKLFDIIKESADDVFKDKDNADFRMPLYAAIETIQKEKIARLKKL